MKLATVVVWYNPTENCVDNILTYNLLMGRVYIIDNSSYSNSELAKKIQNCVYIENCKNLGIAKSLNIVCQKAYEDGFDWCMTMDQDSSWESMYLSKYIEEIERDIINSQCVSYAPMIVIPDETKSYLGDFVRRFKKNNKQEMDSIIDVERVICSGNVINLEVWNKIGRFRESFFIDEVDSEYCYRLIRNGYRIRQICVVHMNHVLGLPKKTFFPRAENHVGVRLFYIFRNKLYINEEYSYFSKKYNYIKDMQIIFLQKIIELRFRDVRYMLQGIFAYYSNSEGSYENYIVKKI